MTGIVTVIVAVVVTHGIGQGGGGVTTVVDVAVIQLVTQVVDTPTCSVVVGGDVVITRSSAGCVRRQVGNVRSVVNNRDPRMGGINVKSIWLVTVHVLIDHDTGSADAGKVSSKAL